MSLGQLDRGIYQVTDVAWQREENRMGKVNSKQIVNFVAKYSIYFITLIFMIICSIVNNRFLTLENLTNILRQVSVYTLLSERIIFL